MAEEGLNPWCDEHWNRIREDQHYNSIAAAFRLPEIALQREDFQETVEDEYDGDLHAAMMDASPLCCYLKQRGALEPIYDDVRMDEPTDVQVENIGDLSKK